MAPLGDRARNDIARRELVGEAISVAVDEHGALTAERLRQQEAVVEQCCGVELDELEVGERRPGVVGEHEPLAERPPGVRRPRPERGIAPRRQQCRGSRECAMVGHDAHATTTLGPEREHLHLVCDIDPRVVPDVVGEHLGDCLPGLGSSGVDDPAHRVAAFAAEVVVELDPPRDELGDACRRLLGENGDRALAAEPTARAKRVGGVQRRGIALADRGGNAALRVPAVRGGDRRLREQEHVRLDGGFERGGQSGDAPADHDQAVRSTLARVARICRFYPHSR